MKYVVLTVRDSAADVYAQPFFSTSNGVAVRSFTDEVNRVDQANALNRHPDDFELYVLGTYDDAGASFDLFGAPQLLARAKDVVVRS